MNAEEYNSAGSPYWATKAFLGLAAPPEHPVWQAEEAPLAAPAGPVVQRHPGFALSRDDSQVVALSGKHSAKRLRQGEAKYARFAYSSRFGFSSLVPGILGRGVADSMLNLVDHEGVHRVKGDVVDHGVDGTIVWTSWSPWPDVRVLTLLHGRTPWHVRVHVVDAGRALRSHEAGFAVGWRGFGASDDDMEQVAQDGLASVETGAGRSAVRDLSPALGGARRGRVFLLPPDANIIEPRALVPVLSAHLPPGQHVLACAVWATDPGEPRWGEVNALEPLLDLASRLA